MTLNAEQKLIAEAFGYNPLNEQEAAEPADLSGCTLEQAMQDGWPVVRWRRDWHFVPTMEQVEEWVFDSLCETPTGSTVEPDHPHSWLSLLGLI